MKILQVDDKWAIEYDPSDNDRPKRLLRYGEQAGTGNPFALNYITAMFYALLKAHEAEAAKDREIEALRAERDALLRELEIERMPKCFSCGVDVRESCPRPADKPCGRAHEGGTRAALKGTGE